MAKKIYHKLIRDKIPEIIKSKGEKPKIRRLNDEEFKGELKRKILEEGRELVEGSEENVINELADLQEIIDTILRTEGFSKSKFKKFQTEKRKRRGGFNKRLFLEFVEDK
jgi:predicted house-cleaning noncanonical NTP pyrophosphatase (MazG superfamily)